MKTRIGIVLALAFLAANPQVLAQELRIEGNVLSASDEKPLTGAHISLLHPWGEAFKTTVSEVNGDFTFSELEPGGYKLKFTYIGFENFLKEVTLTDESVDIGNIQMKEGGVTLEEVEIKGKIPLATMDGDTMSYNADAYKTLPDASAEDLISKMPGVVVENGTVQAQGEDIKEVLVDGKAFFGNDPKAALKNLPAEVISKIQIFDQESEQAKFSGVSDGNTTKTINIITRPEMRNGQFGKWYVGAGTDGRYHGGGNTSFFDGDRRLSIIAQTNNINQQNFSSEDLLNISASGGRRGGGRGGSGGRPGGGDGSSGDFLVQQAGGIAQTHAVGLNYSDSWGEKVEVTGSYFLNFSDRFAENISNVQYIRQENFQESYSENDLSQADNTNHRLNFRINYDINERNSLIWRPRVSLQANDGTSSVDGLTNLEAVLLNSTATDFSSQLNGSSINNDILFRHRFEKKGRTFSVSMKNAYNSNMGLSELLSVNDLQQAQMLIDSINQQSDLDGSGWTHSVNLNYTEPLSDLSSLQFSYNFQDQQDDSDKLTRSYNEEKSEYDLIETNLSNVFESHIVSHRMGAGYSYRKGRDFMIMARANVQLTSQNSSETYPNSLLAKRNYVQFVPFAMIRYSLNDQSNFRLFYRANTQTPSLQQLQNVVDNTNPVQLSTGNPELDQSVSNGIYLRFQNTNLDKATVFYSLLSYSFTQDYIGSQTLTSRSNDPLIEELDIEQGVQLSRPVNLDGYQNMRLYFTYGLPVTFIRSNLNLDLSGTISRIPGLIDEISNLSNNKNVTVGVSLSSNISEKVDFTIGTRIGYNNVNNTAQVQLNNEYWTQSNRFKIGCILPGGFVVRSEIVHQSYSGLAEGFDDDYFLWSAGIGKKIFKNQLGEITLSAFDILNQNQSITRNVTETYIEDLRTNVLQQYFLLSLTYNFRNWATKKEAKPKKDSDSRGRG